MPLGLGAAAAFSGIGTVGNLASTGIQYLANKSLQEDAQSFNAQEAAIARQFSREEAATARQFSHDEAQIARDFEASKYQRTVNDMKAAGLNPASVGLSPPSGGAPQASSAMASSAPAASSGASSVASPTLGNILTSAFNTALIQTMQDERFSNSLVQRTAYQAAKIDNERQRIESMKNRVHLSGSLSIGGRSKSQPSWLKNYEKNFEKGVEDL